jgi:thioredoxin 1
MERITAQEIQRRIENKESFLLKLSASWCGPCKVLTEEISKVNTNVPIYDYDVETDANFSRQLGVRSVPVLKFYKEGTDSFTSVGLKQGHEISSMINQHIVL